MSHVLLLLPVIVVVLAIKVKIIIKKR